jgi:hypothetical protein
VERDVRDRPLDPRLQCERPHRLGARGAAVEVVAAVREDQTSDSSPGAKALRGSVSSSFGQTKSSPSAACSSSLVRSASAGSPCASAFRSSISVNGASRPSASGTRWSGSSAELFASSEVHERW